MSKITHQELDPSLSNEIKSIPKKTSQLENDSDYETTQGSQEKADNALEQAKLYTDENGGGYQLTDKGNAILFDGDLNTLTKAGIYTISKTSVNTPSNNSPWTAIVLPSEDGSNVIQKLYANASSPKALCLKRVGIKNADGNFTWSRVEGVGTIYGWAIESIRLSDSLTNTSITEAATANAVKQVNDKIPVFETGRWTPNISMSNNNGVYSKREGSYVRQGNMVTAFFNLIVTTPPSGSSNFFSITGLPFTASGLLEQRYPVSFGQIINVKYPGTARTLLGWLERYGNQVSIRFYDSVSGASNSTELTGVVQNGTELAGSITYYI